jgi:hypothetical protein
LLDALIEPGPILGRASIPRHQPRGISATPHRLKKQHNFDTNQFSLRPSGTLPRHSVFSFDLRRRLGLGITMKSAIAAHLPDEHFIIRVDGTSKIAPSTFLGCLERRLATSGSISAARRKSAVDGGGKSAKNCFALIQCFEPS